MSKRNFKRCLEADKKAASLNFTALTSHLKESTTNCEYVEVLQHQDFTNVCTPSNAQTNQTTMYPSLPDNFNRSNELATGLINPPNQPISAESKTLKDKLRQLICDFHISHNCVNKLLEILRSEGLDLPKDVRTLFQTPQEPCNN